jgi:hypothetical protein
MPSKNYRCDFCEEEIRKDHLPSHIRTKHAKELALHLIEDAKTSSVNLISAYLRKADPRTMPVPSYLHQETDYWFGLRPIMIEEKDNVTPYLAVPANLESHMTFLHEVMEHVTLNDFMAIQKNINLRSKEVMDLKATLKDTIETLADLGDEHRRTVNRLQSEVDACRKTVKDVNDGVLTTDLYSQIERGERSLKFEESQHKITIERLGALQRKHTALEKKYEEVYQSSTESSNQRCMQVEEVYVKQVERLQESLRKEREKTLKTKKVRRGSEKRKAEKEKLKKDMKETKARMKALEKESDSDSDSDSDSGSDSD